MSESTGSVYSQRLIRAQSDCGLVYLPRSLPQEPAGVSSGHLSESLFSVGSRRVMGARVGVGRQVSSGCPGPTSPKDLCLSSGNRGEGGLLGADKVEVASKGLQENGETPELLF